MCTGVTGKRIVESIFHTVGYYSRSDGKHSQEWRETFSATPTVVTISLGDEDSDEFHLDKICSIKYDLILIKKEKFALYDRVPSKDRRARDSNPDHSASFEDTLPLSYGRWLMERGKNCVYEVDTI